MSYSSEVLADAPLAYYRLAETSGTTMADSSGNGRGGSYVNAPTLGTTGLVATDPADTAASFTGATGGPYATVPVAAWMKPTTISVECWIRPTTVAGIHEIVNRGNQGPASVGQSWRLVQIDSTLYVRMFRNDSTATLTATTGMVLAAGVASHVVFTYDGSWIRIYHNGALATSAAFAGTLNAGDMSLDIARNSYTSGGSWFAGVIDEVAVYGSALTPERIAAHYSAAGAAGPVGSFAVTSPVPTAALSGEYVAPPASGDLAATLPMPDVALVGTYSGPISGALDAALPLPSVALSGTYTGEAPPPPEVVRNGLGLVLDSSATVDVVAPLDSGSLSSTVPLHIIAATVPVPNLVAGRPS